MAVPSHRSAPGRRGRPRSPFPFEVHERSQAEVSVFSQRPHAQRALVDPFDERGGDRDLIEAVLVHLTVLESRPVSWEGRARIPVTPGATFRKNRQRNRPTLLWWGMLLR